MYNAKASTLFKHKPVSRINSFISAFVLLCILLLSSCMKKNTEPGTPASTLPVEDNPLGLVTPASFNWENTIDVNVSLAFIAPDKQPLKNIMVTIYDKKADEGGVVLLTTITDKEGKISQKLKIPSYLKEVVVDPEFMGIIRNATISVVANSITCTIGGPGGYSGNLVPQRSITNPATAVAGRVESTPYVYIGAYDNSGTPKYFEPANDIIETELLSFINASLPEKKPVPSYHPDFLNDNAVTNLNIVELSDVWITFLHEGAGYMNTLAYFTYPTNKPPTSPTQIDSLRVILPNASLSGSGGGLTPGNRVKLGRFPSGVSIGFCLIANGWNGTAVGNGIDKYYSIDELNPEATADKKRHTVLLYDEKRGIFLTGFEDINRTSASCDQDFNDIIFYSQSNPVTAIESQQVLPIDKPVDSDADGVNDVYDRFPGDPLRAYINYYPSENTFSTIAFEDNWPYMGDYDLNDLVVDYRYKIINNGLNNTIEMYCDYVIRASGAAKRNGFGVQFPFASSLVSGVTGSLVTDNKIVTIGSNGTESGNTNAVIFPFDDVFTAVNAPNAFLMNTILSNSYQKTDTIHMKVSFKAPVTGQQLGTAPFNPFLIVNRVRSQEVHLPGYQPTEKVNSNLFQTGNDNTNVLANVFYKTKSNLPYAITIPETWTYPAEHKTILEAYLRFSEWAVSGGLTWSNWYKDPSARNDNNLYKK